MKFSEITKEADQCLKDLDTLYIISQKNKTLARKKNLPSSIIDLITNINHQNIAICNSAGKTGHNKPYEDYVPGEHLHVIDIPRRDVDTSLLAMSFLIDRCRKYCEVDLGNTYLVGTTSTITSFPKKFNSLRSKTKSLYQTLVEEFDKFR